MASISKTSALQDSIRDNWAQINRQKGNPGRNPKEAAALANAVYQNTLRSTSPFIVVGLDQIRKDPDIQNNLRLITGRVQKGQPKGDLPDGSVLGERQWSTLINDLFMIGAVNAGKEVHTTHPEIPVENIWDSKKSRFTSFGRELAILRIAKYTLFRSSLFNQIVFRPNCIVEPITYKLVATALDQVKRQEDALRFIFAIEVADVSSEPTPDIKENEPIS